MVKLTWATLMKCKLVSIMVDQVRSGKQAENAFKKEVWVLFVDQVKLATKFPNLVIMKKTKDKLDNLKGKWNMWLKLWYQVSE